MTSLPIDEAQTQLQRLIDAVSQSHQPVIITGVSGNAVLLSEEDWSSIQETLYLLSVPGMRESIKAGMDTPIKDCEGELDWT
ncbi:MAG: type II toxin-antitoxin system Phd/YefM family antitoxin [Cyanobacteria bacterium P01_C01_bin.121]